MPSQNPSLQFPTFPFQTSANQMTPTSPSTANESPKLQLLIKSLNLQPHIEGGYYHETDRDKSLVPNPFLPPQQIPTLNPHDPELTRNASTTIFYLLTPKRPLGRFHRNKARTVHTLHSGRGVYVILHADETNDGSNVRIESFVVGRDVSNGEKLQWIVEGGKYKASFLLDVGGGEERGMDCAECAGLLISETVIPGFDFNDHDFLQMPKLRELVSPEEAEELGWLVRKE